MNLHGFLARERINYGGAEGVDFTRVYFAAIAYHAIRASNALAQIRGVRVVEIR
jgi:ribonucleoside-diphosphate reductase alpha chain